MPHSVTCRDRTAQGQGSLFQNLAQLPNQSAKRRVLRGDLEKTTSDLDVAGVRELIGGVESRRVVLTAIFFQLRLEACGLTRLELGVEVGARRQRGQAGFVV